MAQIHFGVMYDTETNTITEVGLDEMPVDSDESVFDADEWRRPTAYENDVARNVSLLLGRALSTAIKGA